MISCGHMTGGATSSLSAGSRAFEHILHHAGESRDAQSIGSSGTASNEGVRKRNAASTVGSTGYLRIHGAAANRSTGDFEKHPAGESYVHYYNEFQYVCMCVYLKWLSYLTMCVFFYLISAMGRLYPRLWRTEMDSR